jgi:hypothetical protein
MEVDTLSGRAREWEQPSGRRRSWGASTGARRVSTTAKWARGQAFRDMTVRAAHTQIESNIAKCLRSENMLRQAGRRPAREARRRLSWSIEG